MNVVFLDKKMDSNSEFELFSSKYKFEYGFQVSITRS